MAMLEADSEWTQEPSEGEKKSLEEQKIWHLESHIRIGVLDSEEKMRAAYVDCLIRLAKYIRDGGELLRLLEFSLYRGVADDFALVRATGFESDEMYDFVTQRRKRFEEELRKNAANILADEARRTASGEKAEGESHAPISPGEAG